MAAAAFLIIGNEILSGRTVEKNLPVLAALLDARGLRLRQVRVVRDEADDIVSALNALRQQYDYVFTSGGIGPTHDDITAAAVAQAFGVAVEENPVAVEKMRAFYAAQGMELTAARRRMTRMPAGAEIIPSDFPGAPAFAVGNVMVCAGVPEIFAQMAAAAVARLPAQPRRHSRSVRVYGGESVFSDALAQLAQSAAAQSLEIGSYPKPAYCEVIFSGTDTATINTVFDQFITYLSTHHFKYET